MSEVAGDLYNVALHGDRSVSVLVADVSGHGVPAALVASMVKIAFAAEAERSSDPGRALEGMNRTLWDKFDRAFVTACLVWLDESGATLRYASAGHPPPLVRAIRRGTSSANTGWPTGCGPARGPTRNVSPMR